MFREMLRSKIHRATVTEANLHYMGSITIDEDLLDLADLVENEKVQVVNNSNGARFETYVIAGARRSGVVCLNGAAARLVHPGDRVIIMAYAWVDESDVRSHVPKIVVLGEGNKVVEVKRSEAAGEPEQ